jgi:hypothetical protein
VKSLEGILLYLTTKHGGHVHEKGVVIITSKSFLRDDPRYLAKNAADFTYDWSFLSNGEPGQWISWDFGEKRIRPTDCTMNAFAPKSWIAEGSLDGWTWREIGRRKDKEDFNHRQYAFILGWIETIPPESVASNRHRRRLSVVT